MDKKYFEEEYEAPEEYDYPTCFKRVARIIFIGLVTSAVSLLALWLAGKV